MEMNRTAILIVAAVLLAEGETPDGGVPPTEPHSFVWHWATPENCLLCGKPEDGHTVYQQPDAGATIRRIENVPTGIRIEASVTYACGHTHVRVFWDHVSLRHTDEHAKSHPCQDVWHEGDAIPGDTP